MRKWWHPTGEASLTTTMMTIARTLVCAPLPSYNVRTAGPAQYAAKIRHGAKALPPFGQSSGTAGGRSSTKNSTPGERSFHGRAWPPRTNCRVPLSPSPHSLYRSRSLCLYPPLSFFSRSPALHPRLSISHHSLCFCHTHPPLLTPPPPPPPSTTSVHHPHPPSR
jgi:hypothetical protein